MLTQVHVSMESAKWNCTTQFRGEKKPLLSYHLWFVQIYLHVEMVDEILIMVKEIQVRWISPWLLI